MRAEPAAIVRLCWVAVNGPGHTPRLQAPNPALRSLLLSIRPHHAAFSHRHRQRPVAARADRHHLASPRGSVTWVAVQDGQREVDGGCMATEGAERHAAILVSGSPKSNRCLAPNGTHYLEYDNYPFRTHFARSGLLPRMRLHGGRGNRKEAQRLAVRLSMSAGQTLQGCQGQACADPMERG